jgi:hypothetical protein
VNRFSNKSSVRIFFVSGLAGRGVLGRQVAELYRQPLIEAHSKGPFLVAKRPKISSKGSLAQAAFKAIRRNLSWKSESPKKQLFFRAKKVG